MSVPVADRPSAAGARRRSGPLSRLWRRTLLRQLAGLRHGTLRLVDGERVWRLGAGAPGEARAQGATVRVHDSRFYSDVVFGGTSGAGESYARGRWSVDDLTSLIRLMLRNRHLADDLDRGLAQVAAPIRRLAHSLRSNPRWGSRRNIAAHYDLGNDFFELWLDPSLMYSCAVFANESESLERASLRKIERICHKLRLGPDDQVLEIGTGWGGFALHAAREHGCRVTTTTISHQQHELASRRVRQAGLDDRVSVLRLDYRDLPSLGRRFDKLVSIEMIEAVGHRYLDTFFGVCSDLLKPDGLLLLQAIVIRDHLYERYRRSLDFIQRYIFPGGCLPSLAAMSGSIARRTDLTAVHLEDLTPHYVTTLRRWRERFLANTDRVKELGYTDTFVRLWEFYLCYCEAGFHERTIGDVQLLLAKPFDRRPPLTVPV